MFKSEGTKILQEELLPETKIYILFCFVCNIGIATLAYITNHHPKAKYVCLTLSSRIGSGSGTNKNYLVQMYFMCCFDINYCLHKLREAHCH
jgi:hypothetical protein